MKKRIAVWGITNAIWNSIAKTINPITTEIIAFIDSDIHKQGLVFHGIPIIGFEQLNTDNVDYILIAAYSGFSSIVASLKSLGVPLAKVKPILSKGLSDYLIGDITTFGWEQTLDLYVEPEVMKKETDYYVSLYDDYSKIRNRSANESEWYYGKHLISHACGGYVNGIPMMYTNSKEAFSGTIDNRYSLIECDVLRMPNGEWWCGHDYADLFYSKEKRYTPLSLNGLILALNNQPALTCLLDAKWNDEDDYSEFVHRLNKILKRISDPESVKKRIVLEVYNEATIKCAVENEYQMIFTQYRSEERSCYMKSAIIADRYNISVLADAVGLIIGKQKKHVHIWTDKGFDYFAFTTNNPEDASQVRELGGCGVFSDWLCEMQEDYI